MRGLFGFLLGLAVGVVGALLFVPIIGEKFVIETQSKIQEAFRTLEVGLLEIGHEVKQHVTQVLQDDQGSVETDDDTAEDEGTEDGGRNDDMA
ncbi:YtxH domain-containing protein [Chloroflexi bacterium TSY]|nr:YtxH domain-containing protein [Chloroflexi bacterium TSY]